MIAPAVRPATVTLLIPLRKVAPLDFAVNVQVIEFDRLIWQLRPELFHDAAPFGRRISC